MRVLVATPHPPETAPAGFRFCTIDELFRQADVVSLHCPLTEATRALVDADRLGTMRPGALLVNTARGALVDEGAVAAALHAGTLGGFATDVLSVEPPTAGHPVVGAPRAVVTPHMAWAALAARRRLMDVTVDNVRAYRDGARLNRVD